MPLRVAGPADQNRLERWLFRQDRLYAKFSLGGLGDWLEHGLCLMAEERDSLTGFMLSARVSADFASIIGLAAASDETLAAAVPPLLAALLGILKRDGVKQVTCITSMDWLVGLFERHRFRNVGRLASYVKMGWDTPQVGDAAVSVRRCLPLDVTELVRVDRAAFDPVWHQNEEMMALSLRRSDLFIAAERGGRIVGYACGTGRGNHGHISRLAVTPDVQGQGVGSRLLKESLVRLRGERVEYVTLNTQEDNSRSRRLYERFGFRLAHLDLRVLLRPVVEHT